MCHVKGVSCWSLDTLGGSIRGSTVFDRTGVLYILWYCSYYIGRPEETSEWKIAVIMNKGCHDVGLRKQLLGYHNSWDCWCFILLVWFGVLHCIEVGSAYWRYVETCCTYCNTIRCHHCSTMLQTDPVRSTPCRMPPAALQTSQWQWTTSVFTIWHCKGSYSNAFTECRCLQHSLCGLTVRNI
jgi:hypothetical protein